MFLFAYEFEDKNVLLRISIEFMKTDILGNFIVTIGFENVTFFKKGALMNPKYLFFLTQYQH